MFVYIHISFYISCILVYFVTLKWKDGQTLVIEKGNNCYYNHFNSFSDKGVACLILRQDTLLF